MAQVAIPLAERPNALFNSVFPLSSKRPQICVNNKRVKLDADPVIIKQELYNGLRPLLGIGTSSRYAFGLDGPTAEGQPFLLPLSLCGRMRFVRRPIKADYLQQRSRFLKSPLWQSFSPWQAQLGSDLVTKLLAEVLDQLLGQYVRSAYKRCWVEDVVLHLEFWVQYVFAGLIKFCLETLERSQETTRTKSDDQGYLTNIRGWQDMALTNLGALRVDELFDMIVAWDEKVNAIDDLKHFITSPATRSYVTTRFTETLSSRLLHPGTSTIEILQHYISIIRAFRKLDPKGVLLDRVARSIRKYLKDRDDTVRVVVSGLLSDPYDANGQPITSNQENLSELALELSRRDDAHNHDDDNDLDWDNMNWQPDPIDAAPDYMKSKNTDVIGSVTSLFESKDVFVKELQTTLADRLLKNKPDFALEISVVNHLKQRFGDTALQGCEVMLRDVLDSRKVDEVIRKEQRTGHTTDTSRPRPETGVAKDQPELHAKILSRLFWPMLLDQGFKLPLSVIDQQNSYEKGFETLKQSRKLTWLNSMGHVEVELHLEDRTVAEEVLPYQASVIYAFQSRDDSANTSLSVDELAAQLEMSHALARSACMFWLSKRVLTKIEKDRFSVLERLPSVQYPPSSSSQAALSATTTATSSSSSTLAVEAAATLAAQTASLAAAEEEAAQRKMKMQLYHQFIISMLTNQGAMPLGRIAMMLGIVVPGGFPFGNEELKEFLAGMVRAGEVEVGMGGNYRVV